MSNRVWLLLEWIDRRGLIPQYGVVRINPVGNYGKSLKVGRNIVVQRIPDVPPRRGHILKIAATKDDLKEQQALLEKQIKDFYKMVTNALRTSLANMRDDALRRSAMPRSLRHRHSCGKPAASLAGPFSNGVNPHRHSLPGRRPVHSYPAQAQNTRNRSSMGRASFANKYTLVCSTPKPTTPLQPVKKTVKRDQTVQTDLDGVSRLQRREFIKKEGKNILAHLYRGFLKAFSEVEGVKEMIAKLPASMRALEFHTADEDKSQLKLTVTVVENKTVTEEETNESTLREESIAETEKSQDATLREESVAETEKSQNATPREESVAGTEKSQNATVRNAEIVDNSKEISVQENTEPTQVLNGTAPDMVLIGKFAWVPERLMNEINWSSYTSATRQLLQAVFSRRVLATHSLTGKQSPAFANKPAKKCLEPRLVEDIVTTVSTRCGVSKSLVRNCITIKCTDEAKLYRNRQRCKRDRAAENDTAAPNVSSDESASVE